MATSQLNPELVDALKRLRLGHIALSSPARCDDIGARSRTLRLCATTISPSNPSPHPGTRSCGNGRTRLSGVHRIP